VLPDVSTEEDPPKRRQPHAEVQCAIRQFTAVKTSTSKIRCMIWLCLLQDCKWKWKMKRTELGELRGMFCVVTNFFDIKLSCVRLLVTMTTKSRLNFWAFCTQPYIGDQLVIYYLEHAVFGPIAVFCVMCLYTPFLVRKPEAGRPHVKPRFRGENNTIKENRKQTECEDMDWLHCLRIAASGGFLRARYWAFENPRIRTISW
jgi:hypothetical protein